LTLIIAAMSFAWGHTVNVVSQMEKITEQIKEVQARSTQILALSAEIRGRHRQCVQENAALQSEVWKLRHRKPR